MAAADFCDMPGHRIPTILCTVMVHVSPHNLLGTIVTNVLESDVDHAWLLTDVTKPLPVPSGQFLQISFVLAIDDTPHSHVQQQHE
jgi:hypothetical protein